MEHFILNSAFPFQFSLPSVPPWFILIHAESW
jgi:hypothetical protein